MSLNHQSASLSKSFFLFFLLSLVDSELQTADNNNIHENELEPEEIEEAYEIILEETEQYLDATSSNDRIAADLLEVEDIDAIEGRMLDKGGAHSEVLGTAFTYREVLQVTPEIATATLASASGEAHAGSHDENDIIALKFTGLTRMLIAFLLLITMTQKETPVSASEFHTLRCGPSPFGSWSTRRRWCC
jgi:hypothetical protein